MRCPDCGAQLDPKQPVSAISVDCRRMMPKKRGIARQPAGQLSRHADDDIESVIFTSRPTMLFIKIGYGLAVIGAILLVIALNLIKFIPIPLYVSVPLALALLLIPAYYHLKRNMVR